MTYSPCLLRAAELLRTAKLRPDVLRRAHAELAALNVSLATSDKAGKLTVHIAKKTSELTLDDVAKLLDAVLAKGSFKSDPKGFDLFNAAKEVKNILDRCITELPKTDSDTASLRERYNRLKSELDAKKITAKQFWNELMPELVAALRAQSEIKKESRLLENWERRLYPFLYMKTKWPDVEEAQQILSFLAEIKGEELKQFLDAYSDQIKARYPGLSFDIDSLMGIGRPTMTVQLPPAPAPAAAPASASATPAISVAAPASLAPVLPVAASTRPIVAPVVTVPKPPPVVIAAPSTSAPAVAAMRLGLDRAKRTLGDDYHPDFDKFFENKWQAGERDAESIAISWLESRAPKPAFIATDFEQLKAEWLRILPVGAKGEHTNIALCMASLGQKPNNDSPYGQLIQMLGDIPEGQREILKDYIEKHFGGEQERADGVAETNFLERIFSEVHFSRRAEEAIREAGFEPADVPKIMLKGFHIHGSKRAIGGAIFKEEIVRKNLRAASLDPDKVFTFLNKYHLLNKGKEGLGINNSPEHELGREMMHVVNTQVIAKLQGTGTNGAVVDLPTEISNVRFSAGLNSELGGVFSSQDVATMLLSVFRLHSPKAAVGNRGMSKNIVEENLRKNGLDPDRSLRFLTRVGLLSDGQRTYAIDLHTRNETGRKILAELHPVIDRLKGRPEVSEAEA